MEVDSKPNEEPVEDEKEEMEEVPQETIINEEPTEKEEPKDEVYEDEDGYIGLFHLYFEETRMKFLFNTFYFSNEKNKLP